MASSLRRKSVEPSGSRVPLVGRLRFGSKMRRISSRQGQLLTFRCDPSEETEGDSGSPRVVWGYPLGDREHRSRSFIYAQ